MLPGRDLPANFNWQDPRYRRCVAARLVEEVYELELKRINKKRGVEAEASKWWKELGFGLGEILRDEDDDGCIFGATFVWRGRTQTAGPAPREVLALRGTIFCKPCIHVDARLDAKILLNALLYAEARVGKGLESAKRMIEQHGAAHVWIAGHSLGAALGLLTGRNLAEQGYNLEAHLFNPPFPYSHKFIIFKYYMGMINVAGSRCRAARDVPTSNSSSRRHDMDEIRSSFVAVKEWVPNLYVHRKDPICSRYISYFKAYEKRGMPFTVSALRSSRRQILSVIGKESKPMHIIPSACVIRSTDDVRLPESHKLSQWYNCDLVTESYVFNLSSHSRPLAPLVCHIPPRFVPSSKPFSKPHRLPSFTRITRIDMGDSSDYGSDREFLRAYTDVGNCDEYAEMKLDDSIAPMSDSNDYGSQEFLHDTDDDYEYGEIYGYEHLIPDSSSMIMGEIY